MCASRRRGFSKRRRRLGMTRANQLPTVSVSAIGHQLCAIPRRVLSPSYTFTYGRVTGSRILGRRFLGQVSPGHGSGASELARHDWARQEVNATLVANVAAAYFQLRELDLELEISQKRAGLPQRIAGPDKTLEEHGINSILDVRQAEQLVYTATAEIADLKDASGSRKIFSASCWEIIRARSRRGKRADRSAACADRSCRTSVRAAGAAPGHPTGGGIAGCGQCANRRCQGRLFSRYFADRGSRDSRVRR